MSARSHDWLRHAGGYLGFRGRLPAGKLNAGQKLYFWFVMAAGFGLTASGILMYWQAPLPFWLPLAFTLHDLLATLVLCGVTAHFYLAVVEPWSATGSD